MCQDTERIYQSAGLAQLLASMRETQRVGIVLDHYYQAITRQSGYQR
jgi:hypothetical protein